MKGFLLLSLIFSLAMPNCSGDYSSFNNDLFAHIEETETILNVYDKSIQEAIDSNSFSTIPDLSHKAVVTATRKLEVVKLMEANKEVQELKMAGIAYIEALIGMIKAEEVYSFYSSSLTLEDAKLMDKKNAEAKKNLTDRYEFLLKCQEEVKLKSMK